MKKAIFSIFIFSAASSISFSQSIIKGGPLPIIANDTVFIGVNNVVMLHNDSLKITKACLENRLVEIKENRLILKPTAIGKLVVDITYEDRNEQKIFYSKILPDPRKQN